jgi:hypothetical protein
VIERMKSRTFNIHSEDAALHATFAKWWKAHGWPVLPVEALSPCAVVVEENGEPIAAAWLYLALGCGLSWMEYVVTNPHNSPKKSLNAIEELCNSVRVVAKSLNYGRVITSCRQKSLARTLEKRCGFRKTDDDVTHLISVTGLTYPEGFPKVAPTI